MPGIAAPVSRVRSGVPGADALRHLFPRTITDRGDAYFAQRRVQRLDLHDDGLIVATVRGSREYVVGLAVDDSVLVIECECVYYTDRVQPCKHIWAAVRAADARGLLPDRRVTSLECVDPEDFYDDEPVAPRAQPKQAPWTRFFQALGPATPHRPAPPLRVDEIGYVLVRPPFAPDALTLQIVGRTHDGGRLSKWKQLAIDVDQVAELPAFDRETISILNGRSYSRVEPWLTLRQPFAGAWIERIARAGQLHLQTGDASTSSPIAWDDGEPWSVNVAIRAANGSGVYRIEGEISRGEETLPLADIDMVMPGLVVARGHAARLDAGEDLRWLAALRAKGDVEIPVADADRLRGALLRAPLARVKLPQELDWETVAVEPRPLLRLHGASGAELSAEIFFRYDTWLVAAQSEQMQHIAGRKVFRRDTAREQQYRAQLVPAGFMAVWDGYRLRLAHLEAVVRKLTADGWDIEMDSTPLRVADDLDLQISSGIDWFDLHAAARFGEQRIELPEMLSALTRGEHFVRLADGSVGILNSSWIELLDPVIEAGTKREGALRFRQSQALIVDALLHARTMSVDKPFAELRRNLAGAQPEPQREPASFRGELRPYQRAGLGWMQFLRRTHIGGCLADDMGLGKTVQVLALLQSLREEGVQAPTLVVAPRSLLFNWAAEARKFAPELRVLEHHGSGRDRSAERFTDFDLVLTTYATMRLDVTHLSATEFEYVILDEAQSIKNAGSQVAKAARLLRGRHRLALSGTPIENHLGELWSLFEFLNPGMLGPVRAFNRAFASKKVTPKRREALATALRPLILRRTKEQVAPELPERVEQTLYCELQPEQRRLYDELRDHYRIALLGRIRDEGMNNTRMQVLEALLRLRQAACHPELLGSEETQSAKTELLMDELDDVLASGHRALVFSQFTSFLGIVRRELEARGIQYLYLDGSTRDRQSIVDRFQSGDGPPLFLISLKAGGLGLNLTSADYVFLLDPWWNPAVEAQAIDRAHRIGRTKPVIAYRVIARDTVEEKIVELQARKRALAESIITQDNSVLRKLEVEDVEMLLG